MVSIAVRISLFESGSGVFMNLSANQGLSRWKRILYCFSQFHFSDENWNGSLFKKLSLGTSLFMGVGFIHISPSLWFSLLSRTCYMSC